MYIRVLCTIIYQSDDLALSASDSSPIVNVWRPLNGPVQCSLLAFADSKTAPDEALISVKHRYPDRTGEKFSVRHANEQWY